MKFLAEFIQKLILFEATLFGTFFSATAAQLHFMGPLMMIAIYIGAPLAAAFLTITSED